MTELSNEEIKLLQAYKVCRETRGFDDHCLTKLEKTGFIKIINRNGQMLAETTLKGKNYLDKNPNPE